MNEFFFKNDNSIHYTISCKAVIITIFILQTKKVKIRQSNVSMKDQIAAFKFLAHCEELQVGKMISANRNYSFM